MKAHLLILFLVSSILRAQSFSVYKGDTINRTDANGQKQGKWSIYGKMKRSSCYSDYQVMETGVYLNNKKNGTWFEYHCNGLIKNIINFKDGRPNGESCTFYSNGAIHEHGNWWKSRWIGRYVEYDSTGVKIKENYYDSIPKKDGSMIKNEKFMDSCYFAGFDGQHTLYNKERLKSIDGVFKNGYLVDGKVYFWNKNERLIRVAIYKNGRFIRDSIP